MEIMNPDGVVKYLGILFIVLLITYSYREMRKWVKRNIKSGGLVEGK
ncbi:hypothetical protein P7C64_04s1g04790 [Encephalitozoon intestinalis]